MPKSKPTANPEPIVGQPFRDDDPLFTVIVTDYEPSVPRAYFRRKMASLAAQTCDDFEVLVYHDGPKSRTYEEDLDGGPLHPATQFFVTPSRAGDWGHTSRDLGIRAARGRWIIHTNADNVFYPNLIAVLKATLADPQPWAFAYPPKRYPFGVKGLAKWLDKRWETKLMAPSVVESSDPQILVYAIVMRGNVALMNSQTRVREVAERQGVVFGGVPVKYGATDAMQLVMQRGLWLAEGGWHERAIDSDALLYQGFARKYRVLAVPVVLGEHW
ncbi:MAG: glycosyltransferase family 2 protein [Rhodobacterales bacterium]|nr:glycosyltransferase family 2 protein [Rhodobacterales bacterium]